MAEIVVGLALSHSPQTCVGPEFWDELSGNERGRDALLGVDGQLHSFSELESLAPAQVAEGLKREVTEATHERVQKAMGVLADKLTDAAPDVVVIIGDDQRELFLEDGMPMFAMFWGEEMTDYSRPADVVAKMKPGTRAAFLARHAAEPESYPVASDLAKHLVTECSDSGFDVFQFSKQRPDRSVGHAFTTVQRRILKDQRIPMIPVFENTYYPPNQPSPLRSYEFGKALRAAIEGWPGDEKVAIVASGGLSHITVDEELDRAVLAALEADDRDAIARIPREKMRFGTSEILNWVTAGSALAGLDMSVIEYSPAFRSSAGTGVGMGFCVWE